MGVVSHIKWAELQSVLTPSECMQANTDVMLQIKAIYEGMQCIIETKYVKGHQDSKGNKPDNKKTMKQQLS
eukprot:1209399-Ditylum_brightwellii.AAC.1